MIETLYLDAGGTVARSAFEPTPGMPHRPRYNRLVNFARLTEITYRRWHPCQILTKSETAPTCASAVSGSLLRASDQSVRQFHR